MGPDHQLTVMPGAIGRIKQAGARDDQIAVLTPYKGQLMMIHSIGLPMDTIIAIDGAQGKEYDFILLHLVTPTRGYGLGFMAQLNRLCVVLSRARCDLVDDAAENSWYPVIEEIRDRSANVLRIRLRLAGLSG